MWFSGFFFLILSLIVEVYLWWKWQDALIFLSGRTCTIGGWLNTFLPHCMLETVRSSTFHLRMPHRLPLPSASLARQWSSWRCVWGSLSCWNTALRPSLGRGSCSALVCHSTCWHSWFPQWTVAPQCQQHSCSLRPWHSHSHTWLSARHLSLYSSPGCCHTCLTPSERNKFILVSSDQC